MDMGLKKIWDLLWKDKTVVKTSLVEHVSQSYPITKVIFLLNSCLWSINTHPCACKNTQQSIQLWATWWISSTETRVSWSFQFYFALKWHRPSDCWHRRSHLAASHRVISQNAEWTMSNWAMFWIVFQNQLWRSWYFRMKM